LRFAPPFPFFALLVFSSLAVTSLEPMPAHAAGVSVRNAWARATPPGARMGAVYLTLESAAGDRLIAVSVPRSVAATAQIHETVMVADSSGDGARSGMTMRPVASLELPPGQAVTLEPGGYHIMLLDLKRALRSGGHVPVTLTLEKAGKQKVLASVRAE
jgi:periplasmic copper chaperone A